MARRTVPIAVLGFLVAGQALTAQRGGAPAAQAAADLPHCMPKKPSV